MPRRPLLLATQAQALTTPLQQSLEIPECMSKVGIVSRISPRPARRYRSGAARRKAIASFRSRVHATFPSLPEKLRRLLLLFCSPPRGALRPEEFSHPARGKHSAVKKTPPKFQMDLFHRLAARPES